MDTKSNVKRPLIEIRHPHNLQINTQVSEGQSATSGGGHEPGKRACQEFVCRSQKGDDKHTKSLKMDTSSRSRKFMPKVGANVFPDCLLRPSYPPPLYAKWVVGVWLEGEAVKSVSG